jgi:oligoendopeptidase F
MGEFSALPSREEIPEEQTWNLESIFESDEAWLAACRELELKLPELSSFHGQLGDGPEKLAAYLNLYQECGILAGKISTYAMNAFSVDTTDQASAARSGQARNLVTRFETAISFAEPELITIGFATLREWTQSVPELNFLKHYLNRLEKRQAYVRSEDVEEVIALTSDAFSASWSIYSMLANADLKFEPATASDGSQMEVAQSSIQSLRSHPDREVRRTAWENYADGYLNFRNTFAASLTAAVHRDVFYMRSRGYDSSLRASLAPNNIPVTVFYNLIEVFKDRLPTWHRYWRLRKQALGYEELYEYDIKAPLRAKTPAVPYQQTVDWIAEGMAPLGDEYVQILRNGCTKLGWVDWSRNKGKRAGAFSSGSPGTQPFIMMSYADDVYSLSTLAHELGHSMHSYYAWENQPFLYGDYSLFVAEVASNFNQAMVRDYLFRTQKDTDFQIALIEEAMSNYHRYFFIMPTLARFELEIHRRAEQGAALNAEIMIGLMADLFEEGYGKELVFDRDRIGITWAQFGHLYANFYVYQYATGISGAHALSKAILAGEAGAAERYLDFLKAGDSMYPLEALKKAGVNLNSPEPVEQAFDVLAELVDRLEKLLG